MRVGFGAGERNRTADLRVTSALLYQLSYTGAEPKLYRLGAVFRGQFSP